MIHFRCTIQEGSIADDLRPSLASAIEKACRDNLGEDQGPVNVSWSVIPNGFGFRGGELSTTVLVRGQIPDGCDDETRARLLRSIGDSWCAISGVREDEVIVSARDQSWSG